MTEEILHPDIYKTLGDIAQALAKKNEVPRKTVTLSEFLLEEGDMEWLVERLIPDPSVVLFWAPGGLGKSSLATQLCLSLASGTDFLDWVVPQPRKILYVLVEGNRFYFRDRVLAAKKALGLKGLTATNFLVPTQDYAEFDLRSKGLWDVISEDKPKLVVLDTLSYFVEEENDSKLWKQRIMIPIKQMQAELGTSFLLVHHSSKAETHWRGTSAMRDDADVILSLKRDEETGALSLNCGKNRFGHGYWKVPLHYDPTIPLFGAKEITNEMIRDAIAPLPKKRTWSGK